MHTTGNNYVNTLLFSIITIQTTTSHAVCHIHINYHSPGNTEVSHQHLNAITHGNRSLHTKNHGFSSGNGEPKTKLSKSIIIVG